VVLRFSLTEPLPFSGIKSPLGRSRVRGALIGVIGIHRKRNVRGSLAIPFPGFLAARPS